MAEVRIYPNCPCCQSSSGSSSRRSSSSSLSSKLSSLLSSESSESSLSSLLSSESSEESSESSESSLSSLSVSRSSSRSLVSSEVSSESSQVSASVSSSRSPSSSLVSVSESSSDSMVSGISVVCCSDPVALILYATFSGTLAPIGTIVLTYNAAGQAWEGNAGGTCSVTQVRFECDHVTQQFIMSIGPVGSVNSASATTCDPFLWTSTGTAFGGPCAGAFGVTVSS